jgi:uncharacterized protein YheU (UPF0270 family)
VIEIPSERLSRDILGAVIEEYILREGTDYGVQEASLESKIKQVHRQIIQGDVLISFDPVTENCTLLTRNQFNRYSKDLQTNEGSDL